jgi:hypothetical protein
MERPSRIERARRRATGAKRALAAAAVAAFAVAFVLARVSHPGHAKTSSAVSNSQSTATTESSDDDSGSAIAPSGGSTPSVQTNVS